MKSAVDEKWVRLSVACVNARDALRELIPDLDKALKDTRKGDAELLRRIRELAHRHADGLRLALKHPL